MEQPEIPVSVVVPAYNAVRTIETTLRTVLDQTWKDLEVIVVNDGSTDATVDAARSLDDERVRVLSQPNAGHAAARNTGVAAAVGKYVAFIDADDLWLPRKLERQLAVFDGCPEFGALHCSAVHVDDSAGPLFVSASPDGRNGLLDVLCFRGLPGLMSTLMVDRELLGRIGGFDPSLVILQDWDIAIRLARADKLYSVSEPLALYRKHASSQSTEVDLHIEPGERILARLFDDPTLPAEIAARRSYVYAHFYAMLSGGALQIGRPRHAVYWARRALASDPRVLAYLVALPVRRVRKRLSRRRAARVIAPGLAAFDGPTARTPGTSSADRA